MKATASAAAPSASVGLLGLAGRGGRDRDRGQRGFLLGLLLGAVFVETVGAERRAVGQAGSSLGGLYRRAVAEVDRKGRLALAGRVQMRGKRAAEIFEQPRIDGLGLAETGEHDPRYRQAGRADNGHELVLLAVKARRGGNGARDRALCRLVEAAGRPGQRPVLPDADHDGARLRQRKLGETDVHWGSLAGLLGGNAFASAR